MAFQPITYDVDISLCIDCTESMQPAISSVKAAALQLHQDLASVMDEKNKPIGSLRVKIIAFRDIYDDEAAAIEESEFFTLPQEAERMREFAGKLIAKGGGSAPESALEALSLALKSNWSRRSTTRPRHVVVVWTDEAAHRLEDARHREVLHDLPTDRIADSIEELTSWWYDPATIDSAGRRMVLFAPNLYPWFEIHQKFDHVVWHVAPAGAGLSEGDYRIVVEKIASSVV
ncbi:MAG: vWA domain-containing protein [Pseudomonadota bacterium]